MLQHGTTRFSLLIHRSVVSLPNLLHQTHLPTAIVAKFACFAALLLLVGTALSVQGKAADEFAPIAPTEGSDAVNTTLEENCCEYF
jgi:hypothetical protein